MSVYVGGLTLGLAAKVKFLEKERQHKKRDIQLARPAPTCSGQVGQLYALYCLDSAPSYLCRDLSIARRLFLSSDIKSMTSFVVGIL
ncbi:MAG TPA: hypothetical protein VNB95_02910, partial [Nitrososphaera sp.]|nr:hypothetical protein [Nitrososphaera sp.]